MSVILGYLLMAIPFIVIFAIGAMEVGVIDTLKVFLTVAVVYLMINIGVGLVDGTIAL